MIETMDWNTTSNLLNGYRSEIFLMLASMGLLIYGLFDKNHFRNRLVTGAVMLGSFAFTDFSIAGVLVVFTLFLLFFPDSFGRQSNTQWFLTIAVLIGSQLLLKPTNLLEMYLFIELISYGSYALTAFSFNRGGFEASIKYLIFGAVASALMIFGISYLYGATGSLELNEVLASDGFLAIGAESIDGLLTLGSFLFLCGLLFKIALAPFHIWVPSAYQAAPVEVAAFLSIVPKASALLLLSYLFVFFPPKAIELILGLGIITLIIGTVAAIRQTNARRMIAYGAIAQTGFMLPLAFYSLESLIWYIVAYAIMNMGVFFMLGEFERNGVTRIDQYSDLRTGSAMRGVVLTLLLIALIGLPPTAGFTAKFLVFSELWATYQQAPEGIVLTYFLVAIFATAISLYYYLRLPYYYYFQEPVNPIQGRVSLIYPTVLGVILLILFLAPDLIRFI